MKIMDVVKGVVLLIVAANVIYWFTFAVMARENGIYAGMDYTDAKNQAVDVMALKYGANIADHLRFGKPDVLNTHLASDVLTHGNQVRIFHFIGPKGQRYCVPIWKDSSSLKQEAEAITRGCAFN